MLNLQATGAISQCLKPLNMPYSMSGTIDVAKPPAYRLFTIVQALLLLMEASLEDGEEVMNASSVYIDISCVVSSAIGGLTLSAGKFPQATPLV